MEARLRLRQWLKPALFFAWLVLGAGGIGSAQSPPLGPDLPPDELQRVRFQSMARFQVEVWLNGTRAGMTPFEVNLPAGEYLMSVTGDSLYPIVETISIDREDPIIWIPPIPLTTANYEEAQEALFHRIMEHPANPHLLIAALHMTLDPSDGKDLLRRADRLIPDDPMVDNLRARILVMAGEFDEALRAAERALEKLGRHSIGWRRLAEVLLARGDLEEALDAANQAVLRDPRGWRNQRVRSRVHSALGNEAASISDSERADELYAALHQITEGLSQ